jgi:transketolase
MNFDKLMVNEKLGNTEIDFLKTFSKSCQRTILGMIKTSQSGHPGGACSSLDFLAALYGFRITQTNEKLVVSNGHISPAMYAVLAECGAVNKDEVINTFRQLNSKFEGHVSRHVPGIYFGTGPLGVGISAACGFAVAEKKNKKLKNKISIVRHGKAKHNELNILSSGFELQKNHGLLEESKPLLAKEAEKYKDFDLIISSPFRRTLETAEFFAKTSNCEITTDERLVEIDNGDLDGKDSSEFAKLKTTVATKPMPNGESYADVLERVLEFIYEIDEKYENKKILIVSHGVPTETATDFFAGKPLQVPKKCIQKGKVFSLNNQNKKVFCTIGDGELQEGQVHEAALFAAGKNLDNLTVFVDYNRVQLTGPLDEILPINCAEFFRSKDWNVLEIDGHNYAELWEAINFQSKNGKPVAIIGTTIMGKGIELMEKDGRELKSTWHGKTPKPDEIDNILANDDNLKLSDKELETLELFKKERNFQPAANEFFKFGEKNNEINTSEPVLYAKDELTDCRSAYGQALLSLAKNNKNVLASTADLGGSVMTKFVKTELPNQFIEFGITEQNMVSVCGGLSLANFDNKKNWVPFCSTFGAFMSSRAKDQARVNDINQCNVKMVSTHCGLSVGEDGPTHQAIDDMGSFLGFFNTGVIEPADPNHCDRIIRFVASTFGNFYVRMGRAKLSVLTKENGDILFDKDYKYKYGKTDVLKTGEKITIVATGAAVHEAKKAVEISGIDAEIIIASSIKQFDKTLKDSITKTGKVLTVEDHNAKSGLGSAVALFCAEEGLKLDYFQNVAVAKYELSAKPAELYISAGIDSQSIANILRKI